MSGISTSMLVLANTVTSVYTVLPNNLANVYVSFINKGVVPATVSMALSDIPDNIQNKEYILYSKELASNTTYKSSKYFISNNMSINVYSDEDVVVHVFGSTQPITSYLSTSLLSNRVGMYTEVMATQYPVASTYLDFNNVVGPLANAFRSTTNYVSEYVANLGSAFNFNYTLPNESIYGTYAGTTHNMLGTLLYPTTIENNNADWEAEGIHFLPKMDPHNEPFNVSDDLSKYPLIIWAVGTANTPISIGSIYDVVKELPKQGYIVLVLFYNDSIFGSIPNVFDAGFTKITLEDIPSIAIRSYATSKAIDALEVNPVFNTHIDFTKIGIFGNSYGGTLAAFMTGAKGIADSSNYSFTSLNTDNRITCSYSMVSYLGDQLFGTVLEGMRYITKPTMMVTVENDELTSQLEFSRGVSWISADKYFVTLEGISHSGSLLNEVNYKYTSLFFNAYLKNNTESLIQLQSIQSTSGTEVNYFN